MVIFVKNGESMSVDEPQRSVNWKIESRTDEKMRLCDPLTRIARHTADISRWIEHTSRFAVGRSPIDNLLDFIGSCIAINQSHLNPFPVPSFYLSWSLSCSLSFLSVTFCGTNVVIKSASYVNACVISTSTEPRSVVL